MQLLALLTFGITSILGASEINIFLAFYLKYFLHHTFHLSYLISFTILINMFRLYITGTGVDLQNESIVIIHIQLILILAKDAVILRSNL